MKAAKAGGRPPVYNPVRVTFFLERLADLLRRSKNGEKDAPKCRRELFSVLYFPALVCPPAQQALADHKEFYNAMRSSCTTKGSVAFNLILDGTKKYHFEI
jgi:hypothetical protein